jgi:hypothetical protein
MELTPDSDYVRTELREMNGNSQASWSNTDGMNVKFEFEKLKK